MLQLPPTLPPNITPLKDFFKIPEYIEYCKIFFPFDGFRGIFGLTERIVQSRFHAGNEGFFDAWHKYYTSKPVFCGKSHEYMKEVSPINCPLKGNPVCGHLEDTSTFSTVCIASYIAHLLNGEKIDPRPLLIPPEKLDSRVASSREFFNITWIRASLVKHTIEQERKIWEQMQKNRTRLHGVLTEYQYI